MSEVNARRGARILYAVRRRVGGDSQVFEAALALSDDDRAKLADKLVESLDGEIDRTPSCRWTKPSRVCTELRAYDDAPPLRRGRSDAEVRDRFPFAVVFYVEEDEVHVVAVEALRKSPGYWRARLR